jgi:GTP pyrophosphokinase
MKLFNINSIDLSSDFTLRAYEFAKSKHYGQVRKNTEEPFIVHPLAVASVIKQLRHDDNMIVASLLHDVIEDTDVELPEIIENFNDTVASLVLELTINNEEKKKIGKRKYLVCKMNNMSSDALTIKLVDRLHNISDLNMNMVPVGFAKWYWKETKYILEHIDRNLNKEQLALISLINSILDYVKVLYNFNYQISAD